MSNIKILSGKDVSRKVYSELLPRIVLLKKKNITPGLAVILVGDNPASKVYIKSKARKFKSLGLFSETILLNQAIKESELCKIILSLNKNPKFHGILIQLPLPKHLNKNQILCKISPHKDVDGFHPENAGLLSQGVPRFIPCTPKGIMRIFKHYKISLDGKHVLVLGRSNIVGRPMSLLTSAKIDSANATTTVCHSGTENIENYTESADVVISAIGIPGYLKGSMLKTDAVIIDVGINRVKTDNDKGYSLTGDFDWNSIKNIVSAATPVPGGVGPMTIAMLVENTVEAAEQMIAIS